MILWRVGVDARLVRRVTSHSRRGSHSGEWNRGTRGFGGRIPTTGAALHPIQIDGVATVGVQAQPAGILPLAVPKRYPMSETLFKYDEVSQSRTTLISIM